MKTLNFVNHPKETNKLVTNPDQQVIKRTLMKAVVAKASPTSLTKCLNLHSVLNRKYPGEFRGRKFIQEYKTNHQSNINPKNNPKNYDHSHVRDDAGVNCSHATYTNIEETKTRKIVMILTSSHGKDAPLGVYVGKLDAVKAEGSFIPLKDFVTKEPLLDSHGNLIPNPNKGGQYVAVSPNPRVVKKIWNTKCLMMIQYNNIWINMKISLEHT